MTRWMTHACRADQGECPTRRPKGETETVAEAMALLQRDFAKCIRERDAALARAPSCEHCGKPAVCLGCYETASAFSYACGECCGHGNEDGRCFPIADVPARYDAALARAEAAEQDHERKHVMWHEERRVTTALQTRLAEATALLQAVAARKERQREIVTFLSATPAPPATAEPENPEADERHAKLVSVADKLRASRILVERIEAAVDDMFAMPDEKLQYIRDLIRAAKEGT